MPDELQELESVLSTRSKRCCAFGSPQTQAAPAFDSFRARALRTARFPARRQRSRYRDQRVHLLRVLTLKPQSRTMFYVARGDDQNCARQPHAGALPNDRSVTRPTPLSLVPAVLSHSGTCLHFAWVSLTKTSANFTECSRP